MLKKTKGIIFHQVKYSESSVIVKIYTELLGLQTYILKGVRKKKSKIKSNLLQPLTLVEMEVYHKENSEINFIKEIRNTYHFKSLPFEIYKSSIALFITEILYKSIREEEPNKNLFDFIFNSVKFLDSTEEEISNFHLLFAIQLTKYLGIFPNGKYSETNKYFDLQEGNFQEILPKHFNYIDKNTSKYFYELSLLNYEKMNSINISNKIRKELLEKIILYYQIHLPGIKEINSNQILSEGLSESY